MISLWIRQAMTKALVLAVTVLTLLSIQTAASTPGPSPSVSFDVNLVYTTRLHPNCTTTLGPQPTVVVSTRYTPENDDDFVEWTPMLVYTDAGPHQGCTNIKLPKSSKRYQFRVQLSCADRRHCFTIGNVTCPYGLSASIRDQWSGLWHGSNIIGSLLCARSSIVQRNYYSRTFHFCDNGNSVNLTDDIYASNNSTQNNCTDLFPMSSCLNNPPLANVTRVCRCNGTWSPNPCQPSISQAEELISEGKAEQGLKVLLELPPNSINNTQRLEVLRSAFNKQSEMGVTKSFVQTSIKVIDEIPTDENVPDSADNSEFLLVLDEIALSLRRNETISSTDGSIVLRVREVFSGNGRVLGIQVDNSYISLPGELFENLNESVFVASFYFEDIAHLFPNEVNSSISPLVISSALSCTDCRTSNLTENVTILFDLPPRMTNNKTECVFADLRRESGTNFWKSNGCTTVDFKNGSVMCSCNHLTHFAILISPGVEIPPVHQKVLTVIGQVFVSISLVFLLATIVILTIQKSLWNMRNYIHCMLCANLIAAQLVFVVGVERTENEAVCSAIAVLLHYLFLVVFMWMLMEGVVLYLVLVKVFVKHNTRRYIAAFTVASYGIPLVYMALVVPLGFLVNTDNIGNHYGQYNPTSGEVLACWLRYDTHFIWAFIAPVILIITVNIGFLIMAIVVMYRLAKEKEAKKSIVTKSKYWIKQVITLVVVMGIAWIGNILFFNVNLLFVAYIMTIFIAGQGIIIFILFVPLSKQVMDAYKKWWKKRMKLSSAATLSESALQTKHQAIALSKKSSKEDKLDQCNDTFKQSEEKFTTSEIVTNRTSEDNSALMEKA